MRHFLSLFMLTHISCFLACAGDNVSLEPLVSPSEKYISSVLESLANSQTLIDDMSQAADAAASRYIGGGRIFVTDDETIFRTGEEETKIMPGGGFAYPMHEDWGGFVAEACDRSGGLRHIQPVPVQGVLNDQDIVLAGTIGLDPDSQLAQLTAYKNSGALIILFGSPDSKTVAIADYFIDNGLENGIIPVMDVNGDENIGPVACVANVINMWAFTSEFVAAVTRQGKMPALWQSMFIPGAAARNEHIGDFVFHPDMEITPVAKGVLGRQYVTSVQGFLKKIKATELPKFAEAGKLSAETINDGGKIVASIIGHFMTSQRRMPGFPDFLTIRENEYGSEQLKGVLGENDMWMHVGYSYYPVRELKYIREIGAQSVTVFTPGPTDIGEGNPEPIDTSLLDVYIDPYWKHGDAAVTVPGYDTMIIPPSGVVMSTCYWMLIGETMAVLNAK